MWPFKRNKQDDSEVPEYAQIDFDNPIDSAIWELELQLLAQEGHWPNLDVQTIYTLMDNGICIHDIQDRAEEIHNEMCEVK